MPAGHEWSALKHGSAGMYARHTIGRCISLQKPSTRTQCSFMTYMPSPVSAVEGKSLYGGGWDAGPHAVKVAVWWDFEDCDIPAGVPPRKVGINIVSALRMRGYKGPVSITAYGDTWQLSRSTQEALASTGIGLHHLPSTRKNSSSDRTLMVDLVLWTLDHPPPAHLFIISTDADLSSALHSLRMKNYNVLLACKSQSASPALLAAATSVWHWAKLARGEGLVAQTNVDSHDDGRNGGNRNSGLGPPYMTPPPPPPPPSPCSGNNGEASSTSIHIKAPPEVPGRPTANTTSHGDDTKIPLDTFHRDVCTLLQQAAASLEPRHFQDQKKSSGRSSSAHMAESSSLFSANDNDRRDSPAAEPSLEQTRNWKSDQIVFQGNVEIAAESIPRNAQQSLTNIRKTSDAATEMTNVEAAKGNQDFDEQAYKENQQGSSDTSLKSQDATNSEEAVFQTSKSGKLTSKSIGEVESSKTKNSAKHAGYISEEVKQAGTRCSSNVENDIEKGVCDHAHLEQHAGHPDPEFQPEIVEESANVQGTESSFSDAADSHQTLGNQKWTWRKFLFGRDKEKNSTKANSADSSSATSNETEGQSFEASCTESSFEQENEQHKEQHKEQEKPSDKQSVEERAVEAGNLDNNKSQSYRSSKKGTWLNIFRRSTVATENITAEVWDDVNRFLQTSEAVSMLSKSQNQKQFAKLLRESGPLSIRDWEENTISQLIDILVKEKHWVQVDSSEWQPAVISLKVDAETLESSNDTVAAVDAERSLEVDQTGAMSSTEAMPAKDSSDEPVWESGKEHYPTLKELRIWLVYLLHVEQERKTFDVSLLRAEFRRQFGLPLDLSLFGCARVKDLVSSLQDILHIHYPKPSVCVIKAKAVSNQRKVYPRALSDYSLLLGELLLEHPHGVPISMMKPVFYDKFSCKLDHENLGYARLDQFLRAARKDIYAKLDSQEQSLYVFIDRQRELMVEEEDYEKGDVNIVVDKEINL